MKKFLLTLSLFLIPTIGHCTTTWYLCTTPAGGWSNTGSWTSVMGDQATCAAALGAPAAGDTAILNSSSGSVALDSATADVATTVTMTGYTGTLTVTNGDILIVSGGTVTLGGTITGTGTLKVTGSETLTSSGVTWPGALIISGTTTATFSNGGATWTNSGLVTSTGAATFNKTTTGDTLTMSGGFTMNGNALNSGTATLILTGGTWTVNIGTIVYNNVTLAGNVTISGTLSYGNSNTLLYSSGNITTTGSVLNLFDSCTVNTNGVIWNNISENSGGNQTYTLGSSLTATGTMTLSNPTTTFSGAFPISVGTLTVGTGDNLTLVAAQTMYISTALNLIGSTGSTTTIKSATSSSPTYIQYTGTKANQNIDGVIFTDVISTNGTLYNYNGNTLLRTSGVKNVNASNIYSRPINTFNGV